VCVLCSGSLFDDVQYMGLCSLLYELVCRQNYPHLPVWEILSLSLMTDDSEKKRRRKAWQTVMSSNLGSLLPLEEEKGIIHK